MSIIQDEGQLCPDRLVCTPSHQLWLALQLVLTVSKDPSTSAIECAGPSVTARTGGSEAAGESALRSAGGSGRPVEGPKGVLVGVDAHKLPRTVRT